MYDLKTSFNVNLLYEGSLKIICYSRVRKLSKGFVCLVNYHKGHFRLKLYVTALILSDWRKDEVLGVGQALITL